MRALNVGTSTYIQTDVTQSIGRFEGKAESDTVNRYVLTVNHKRFPFEENPKARANYKTHLVVVKYFHGRVDSKSGSSSAQPARNRSNRSSFALGDAALVSIAGVLRKRMCV